MIKTYRIWLALSRFPIRISLTMPIRIQSLPRPSSLVRADGKKIDGINELVHMVFLDWWVQLRGDKYNPPSQQRPHPSMKDRALSGEHEIVGLKGPVGPGGAFEPLKL